MRKLKFLRRGQGGARLREELETWTHVLLAVGAALLVFATLKAQAAHAAEPASDVAAPTLPSREPGGSYSAAAPHGTDQHVSAAGRVS
jgi:hypothetical protein